MKDVIVAPDFPGGELERLRKERLTSLLQARDDPAAIIQLAFPRLVFGEKHRYGSPAGGSTADVKALSVDDLRAFHRRFYRPENAVLVVVGDITPGVLLPLLERTFSGWKGPAAAPAVPVPAAPQLTNRRVYLIDKPGAAQSQIRIGWVGIPRSAPDYPIVQVLNTVFGGAFTSRLNTNLRETHGYAYGAASGFEARLSPGAFLAAAGVQTDKTAEALQEFFNEFAGILKPIPDAELQKAKNYLTFGFPAGFETSADLAARLEELVVYTLPEDYFPAYIRRVAQVSVSDVEQAARRYIQPGRFAVVVVGDRKTIEAGIRKLNLGEIEVLTVDQALGPM